ncbi:MAG TPA: protoglobin domain-containing protein [Actinomycetaceae bacterium]|nr:protoglobin domain-containing protein [Actinomycetaceae bacterium]
MTTAPAGYSFDTDLPPSPVTREQLQELLTDVMWTDADAQALRRAGEILEPQVSDVLDAWYDFIGSTPHLVQVFAGTDGQPDTDYLGRVRGRFEQWVIDLCKRPFDEQWLAYQEEIGLRHHPTKKNQTDGVDSAWRHVPMKDMLALVVPVTLTIRDFLAREETDRAQLDAMQNAWFKAVTVTLVLWARPYAGELW